MILLLYFRLSKVVIKCLIERNKLELLNETVDTFSTIPESGLIDVLMYYLQCTDTQFTGITEVPQLQMEIDPLDKDGDSKYYIFMLFIYHSASTQTTG